MAGRHFALSAFVAFAAMGSATAFAPVSPVALRAANKLGSVQASPLPKLKGAAPRLRSAPSIKMAAATDARYSPPWPLIFHVSAIVLKLCGHRTPQLGALLLLVPWDHWGTSNRGAHRLPV